MVLFSQHEAALKNERNTISRIDYYLKGKGREFIEFEDLIAFIDGETTVFNKIMDIVSYDALRPVLYAMVRSFDIAASEHNRANHLISLKRDIVEFLDDAFFVPEVIHDSRWLISQRDIEWLVKDLNKQHARMCDKLYVKVECIEGYVEGMSPKFRYFITIPSHHMSVSLPGFKRFNQYRKKRKNHSS